MNILITGHSGFLGSHTANYFKEKGHKVYGVSRSLINDCAYQQYSFDIINKDKLSQLVSEKCIDQIIHIAGKALVADCDRDPYNAYKINGLGAASILEAARFAKCKKVVLVETDKVYGFQRVIPTNEDAIPNPNSPYELSKVLATQFCEFYRRHYNMNVISVRPVNLFGEGDFSYTRIIPAAMKNIFSNQGIPVHEHGDKIYRDFLYIKDAAEMLYILSANENKHNIYNFSSNSSISISKLAIEITRILNYTIDPVIIKKPGEYSEIPYQAIDGSRFIEEFNYQFTPFEIAIKETYEAYKKEKL
jgi:nucleoside-diphosphate-sugar epimerase